jgi:hypothetical protein
MSAHTYPRSFEDQGTVKVHLPVLRFFRRRRLLDLCPLRDEVRDDLRLDSLSWTELEVKLT